MQSKADKEIVLPVKANEEHAVRATAVYHVGCGYRCMYSEIFIHFIGNFFSVFLVQTFRIRWA